MEHNSIRSTASFKLISKFQQTTSSSKNLKSPQQRSHFSRRQEAVKPSRCFRSPRKSRKHITKRKLQGRKKNMKQSKREVAPLPTTPPTVEERSVLQSYRQEQQGQYKKKEEGFLVLITKMKRRNSILETEWKQEDKKALSVLQPSSEEREKQNPKRILGFICSSKITYISKQTKKHVELSAPLTESICTTRSPLHLHMT